MSVLYVKINAAKEVEYWLDGVLLTGKAADAMTGKQFKEVIIDEWFTFKTVSLSTDK